MARLSLRLAAVAAFSCAAAPLFAGCNNSDDSSNRKCGDSVTAYANPGKGSSCSSSAPIDLSYCERLPSTRCPAGTPPSFACLSSSLGDGYIVQLSPCAEIDSIPLSWAFADAHGEAGPGAIGDCRAAANTCDQGELSNIPGMDVPSGANAD